MLPDLRFLNWSKSPKKCHFFQCQQVLPDLILLIWSNSAWKESVTRFYFTKLATTFCFCTSLKGKRLWFSTFLKQVSTMPKLNHHKSKSVDTKSNFGIEPWDPSIMSTLLMYVDMCTYTEQIGFSRSWRVQVISDFLTRTTTRMAAKTKDAIIWKGERGAKQNKWLFWVMCRAVLSSSLLSFSRFLLSFTTKEHWNKWSKIKKKSCFLNKHTTYLFGIFCPFLTYWGK